MDTWSKWIRDPRGVWLRTAVLQVHLWVGIALAVYIVVICLSGSILVYRNELYGAFAPTPDDPMPLGFRATSWLLDLHDNLLAGERGRRTNGVGAALVIVMGLTGLIVWWPGVRRWRRSLLLDVRGNWRQVNWNLHSATGIWFVGFILLWGVSGLYLSYPAPFNTTVEYFLPADEATGFNETADRILFWFGYSHFGRFGGRIPGCSRGTCNDVFKAVWAVAGAAPVVMAVTGAIMWWSRTRRRPKSRTAPQML